jgi:hypothetical protein
MRGIEVTRLDVQDRTIGFFGLRQFSAPVKVHGLVKLNLESVRIHVPSTQFRHELPQ